MNLRSGLLLVVLVFAVGYSATVSFWGPLFLAAGLGITALILHDPRWGLWLLAAGLTVAPIWSTHPAARLINFVIPILTIASWAIRTRVRRMDPRPLPGGLGTWWLVFVGWIVLTALLSSHPSLGFIHAVRYVILGLVLLVAANVWTPTDVGRALLLYSLLLVPLALVGLQQLAAYGISGLVAHRITDPYRLSSLYHNPNTLGVVMASGLTVLLAHGLSGRRVRLLPSIVLAFAGLSLAAGLLVSLSRSSFLYLLASMVTLATCSRRLRWGILIVAGAVAMYFLVVPIPVWVYSTLRLGAGSSYREALWSAGLEMMIDHPWTGVGPGGGMFEFYRQAYLPSAVSRVLIPMRAGAAHNVFVTNGAEMGWIGLLLTIAVFVLFWRRLPGALRRYRKGDWIQGAAAAGIVGLSVRAVFERGYTVGLGHLSDDLLFFLFGLVLLHPKDAAGDWRIAVPAQSLRSARTGGQRLWANLVDHWRQRGLPVRCEDDAPVPSTLRDQPLPLLFWYWRAYREMDRGLLVMDQSDHGRMALLLRTQRRKRAIRVIVVVNHLRESFRFAHPLYVRLARRNETSTLRHAHRIIVHTREEARLVEGRGIAPDRISIVPVGIEASSRRLNIRDLGPEEPLRLLWVGGDFARKGMDVLLEALAATPPPLPRLTVVGDPGEPGAKAHTQDRVHKLGMEECVRFLGFVPAEVLDSLWFENDVFVLPSLHEGHGSALDEALARGLPAIVSDLPVFRERLGADDVCFLPPGDAPAWTSALTRMRSPELRRALAAGGFRRAQGFPNWQETYGRYTEVLLGELAHLGIRR